NAAFNESVKDEKNTMSGLSNPELEAIRYDPDNSAERRAAATGMLASKGGMGDVMTTFTALGSAMRLAKAAPASAARDAEIEALTAMQQQFMEDVGSRLPASVTGPAK